MSFLNVGSGKFEAILKTERIVNKGGSVVNNENSDVSNEELR
jgi:hypothetical protein